MKIFITVGTNEFDELIRIIDKNIGKNKKYNIFAQIGNGEYEPKYIKWARWLDPKELIKKYKWADIIICGHGAGTLFEILNKFSNKRIISIEQKQKVKLGDTSDLAKELSKEGYIKFLKDVSQIENVINKIKKWKPKRYIPPKCEMHKIIEEFLK